jgi:hypothetical protein
VRAGSLGKRSSNSTICWPIGASERAEEEEGSHSTLPLRRRLGIHRGCPEAPDPQVSVRADGGDPKFSQQGLRKHEVQQEDTAVQKNVLHDQTKDERPQIEGVVNSI